MGSVRPNATRLGPRVKITGLLVFCMLAVIGESIHGMGLMLALESKGFSPQNNDLSGKYHLRTSDKWCLWAMLLAGIAAIFLKFLR